MKTTVRIKKSVYNEAYYDYLNAEQRTQIFFGGSSSGKSVFVAQRCVDDLLQGGRNYLVCRQVGKSLKKSVYTEIVKVIKRWGVESLFKISKSEMVITCVNGYQAVFTGLDDVEKIKSMTPEKGVFTDIWVEEATETNKDSITQLRKRQRGKSEKKKRIILTFNPILQTHWIYEDYFSKLMVDFSTEKGDKKPKIYYDDDLLILKTTHWNNKFIEDDDRKDLENETDEYFHNVYTLGNWGILGDVIFKNWKCVDLTDASSEYYLPVEQRTNRRNGLDFGFSSDPAAASSMHYDKMRKRLYIYDELYERGLTNQELAGLLKVMIGKDLITCDSSEPKSIQELIVEGINARGARKGKDSVNFGIQWLQGIELIIDEKCINTKREISTYHWKKDKDGNSMRIPVDKDNHIIDDIRYAMEDDMIELESEAIENPWN